VERAILVSDDDEIQPSDLMLHGERAIAPWAERMTLAQATEPLRETHTTPHASRPAAAVPAYAGLDEDDDPEEGETLAGVTLGQTDTDIVSLEALKRQAVERAYRLC